RGFTNIFRTEYQVVNLDRLAALGEKNITPEVMVKNGLAGKNDLIKVLGDGELKSAVTVQAHKFSKSAQEKIEKGGGKVELIGGAAAETAAKDAPKAEAKGNQEQGKGQAKPRKK